MIFNLFFFHDDDHKTWIHKSNNKLKTKKKQTEIFDKKIQIVHMTFDYGQWFALYKINKMYIIYI